jgi:microcystin-dependent protein
MSITNEGIIINNEPLFSLPVGTIIMWLSQTLPSTNFLFCDGSTYNPTYYADLYTIIKNSYGGNTVSPKLPNLSGRVPIGGSVDTTLGLLPSNVINVTPMPSVSNATNKTGGNSTLLPSQLIHKHNVNSGGTTYVTGINNTNNTDWNSDVENYYVMGGAFSPPNRMVGQDEPPSTHLPPHRIVNYIIYAGYNYTPGANNYL